MFRTSGCGSDDDHMDATAMLLFKILLRPCRVIPRLCIGVFLLFLFYKFPTLAFITF